MCLYKCKLCLINFENGLIFHYDEILFPNIMLQKILKKTIYLELSGKPKTNFVVRFKNRFVSSILSNAHGNYKEGTHKLFKTSRSSI